MSKTFSQLHNEIMEATFTTPKRTWGADRAMMIEIDSHLYHVYTETEAWMISNHPEVACNSSYANCVDFEMVFARLHGFGRMTASWGEYKRNEESNEVFVPTTPETFTRKELLSMFFPTELVRLDYARDIRAAGDCDNSGLDSLEVAIHRMMDEVLNS